MKESNLKQKVQLKPKMIEVFLHCILTKMIKSIKKEFNLLLEKLKIVKQKKIEVSLHYIQINKKKSIQKVFKNHLEKQKILKLKQKI